jgi:nucleoid DNA-binding protein
MTEFEGLPGIDEFSSSIGEGFPIQVSELEYIVDAITAHTNVTKEQATRILSLFFQEIRSLMLRGEIIDIKGFGDFFVSSPKTTGLRKKIFIKFKPKKSFIKRLNK